LGRPSLKKLVWPWQEFGEGGQLIGIEATANLLRISLFPLKYSFELPIEPLLNMIDEVINSVKYRIVRVQSSVENVVFIIKPLVEKFQIL